MFKMAEQEETLVVDPDLQIRGGGGGGGGRGLKKKGPSPGSATERDSIS